MAFPFGQKRFAKSVSTTATENSGGPDDTTLHEPHYSLAPESHRNPGGSRLREGAQAILDGRTAGNQREDARVAHDDVDQWPHSLNAGTTRSSFIVIRIPASRALRIAWMVAEGQR